MMKVGSLKVPLLLAFADDLLVICKSKELLEKIIKAIEECLSKVGLEINNKKSQILIRVSNSIAKQTEEMELNRKKYKVCTSIRYLGTYLTSTLNRPATTKKRCVNAMKAAKTIIDFCKNYRPSWQIGRIMYNTVIAPSILYGTKTATLTKRSRQQLARYEKQIIREIWAHCRKNPTTKLNIREQLKGKTINRRVRVNRIAYYGHISRREKAHPLKSAFELSFHNKKEGRPSYTWKDSLLQDLSKYDGVSINDWNELLKDKHKLKQKAEEIYNNSESEITSGEDSEN